MPKPQARDLSEFKRGAEAMRALIIKSVGEQIVNLRSSNGPAADSILRWRDTKCPTVAELLASEMNATAPAGLAIGAGLPKLEITDDDLPF